MYFMHAAKRKKKRTQVMRRIKDSTCLRCERYIVIFICVYVIAWWMSWYLCVAVWVCVTVPELQIKYQLCSPSVTCQPHRGQQAGPNKIMINPPPASNTTLSPLTMTEFTLKETVHRVRVEKWVVSSVKREIGLKKLSGWKKLPTKQLFIAVSSQSQLCESK